MKKIVITVLILLTIQAYTSHAPAKIESFEAPQVQKDSCVRALCSLQLQHTVRLGTLPSSSAESAISLLDRQLRSRFSM